MKVYICEADQGKEKSMQAILGHYSYKVVTVNKNTDLFKKVSMHRPALIIINETFTDDLGVDTVNRLKNDPSTANIPVIYIGKENNGIDALYPNKSNYIETVQEPVKIKNLRHYIDRWTTLRSLYMKH